MGCLIQSVFILCNRLVFLSFPSVQRPGHPQGSVLRGTKLLQTTTQTLPAEDRDGKPVSVFASSPEPSPGKAQVNLPTAVSVSAEEVGNVLPFLTSFLSTFLYGAHFAWYFSF